MKKLLSLICSLVLMVTLIFTLGACSQYYNCKKSPTLDLSQAEREYKNKGWEVYRLNESQREYYFDALSVAIKDALVAYDNSKDYDHELIIIEFDSKKSAKAYYNYYLTHILWGDEEVLYWLNHLLKEYGKDLKSGDLEDLEEYIQYKEEMQEKISAGYDGFFVWFEGAVGS